MKTLFDARFLRDIRKISDKRVKRQIEITLKEIDSASSLNELRQLKKLQGEKNYYRLRIGDFRIGFRFINETIILERCLNRKEIYRYYPPK